MASETPYYSGIPKNFYNNLKWREEVLTKAANDVTFAEAAKKMCSEDLLFYINGFCWTKDPRYPDMPVMPFITYDYQDDALLDLLTGLSRGFDVVWPKSRTMGASWMAIMFIEWMWHFFPNLDFGIGSSKADLVDSKNDPGSLFGKIDFLHNNQPRWLLPTGRWFGGEDVNRTHMKVVNADNGSTIIGDSTTENMFRAKRLTMTYLDELAAFEVKEGYEALQSTREVSRCRLVSSTYKGEDNAFYDLVHKTAAKSFEMHWTIHPLYKKGLYSSHKDRGVYVLDLIDKEFKDKVLVLRKEWMDEKELYFPDSYPFILDGKTRSPWYDTQEARCATKQEIAQEIDMDPQGSAFPFFDRIFIEKLINEYCTAPLFTGVIAYDENTLEPKGFREQEHGPLSLWFDFADIENEIKTDTHFIYRKSFGIGCDISAGTGASNSAACIVDIETGRKVGVWKSPDIDPITFADRVVALCKYFNNAKLIWDSSGATGSSFSKRIIEIGYTNVFYRRKSDEKYGAAYEDKPGYFLQPKDKSTLLREYRSSLEKRTYINVSEGGMRETLRFIFEPGGKIEHSGAVNSQDPSGAREAHGDEVIADALASKLAVGEEREEKKKETGIPMFSIAWFMKEEKDKLEKANYNNNYW